MKLWKVPARLPFGLSLAFAGWAMQVTYAEGTWPYRVAIAMVVMGAVQVGIGLGILEERARKGK